MQRKDERHKKGRRECNNVNDVFRHVHGKDGDEVVVEGGMEEGREGGKGREGKRLVVLLENQKVSN